MYINIWRRRGKQGIWVNFSFFTTCTTIVLLSEIINPWNTQLRMNYTDFAVEHFQSRPLWGLFYKENLLQSTRLRKQQECCGICFRLSPGTVYSVSPVEMPRYILVIWQVKSSGTLSLFCYQGSSVEFSHIWERNEWVLHQKVYSKGRVNGHEHKGYCNVPNKCSCLYGTHGDREAEQFWNMFFLITEPRDAKMWKI